MKRRARPAPASQKEKVKAFLDERLDQGSDGAYEALQLLRGQVQRGLKQGGAEAARAVEGAAEGALALIGRGFVPAGSEMAGHLVEAVEAVDRLQPSPPLGYDACVGLLEQVDDAYEARAKELTKEEVRVRKKKKKLL